MIRKILFSSLLLIGIQLHATVINECQTDIYYGNGIMTTEDEATKALHETLKPAILHDIYDGDTAKMNRMHHFFSSSVGMHTRVAIPLYTPMQEQASEELT